MAKKPYFGDKNRNILETHFFYKNRASSLFYIHWRLTSCKKSEKSNGGKYHNFLLLTDWRLKEWKLSINALYSSYLPMASNQTIKDRPHQRQWWVGRVSLVSTYLPVLNPGRWKQRNNRRRTDGRTDRRTIPFRRCFSHQKVWHTYSMRSTTLQNEK